MTRRFFFLIALLACFAVSGCGKQTETTPAAPPTGAASAAKTSYAWPAPPPGPFKVALLTTGPVNDDGWNQLAYSGVQQVGQELGAQVDKQESLKPDQFEDAIRDFANRGYNVIFAHGEEFGAAAAKIAPQYPKTLIVTSGGTNFGPNLMAIDFRTEEGTYLQGMEAALVSKSGKGGYIAGQQLPQVDKAVKAFEAGAKSVNPSFQLTTLYLTGQDPWNDPTGAKASTQTLLNNGVDVLAHNCDASAEGMFQTAGDKPGVYTFGVNSDQNHKAPDVLSSVYLDFPKAYTDICRAVKAGTFKVQPMLLGMKEGDVRLIDNPKLANVIPPAGKAKVRQAAQQIAAGTLKVAGS